MPLCNTLRSAVTIISESQTLENWFFTFHFKLIRRIWICYGNSNLLSSSRLFNNWTFSAKLSTQPRVQRKLFARKNCKLISSFAQWTFEEQIEQTILKKFTSWADIYWIFSVFKINNWNIYGSLMFTYRIIQPVSENVINFINFEA